MKDKVKRILMDRDYVRELQDGMIENLTTRTIREKTFPNNKIDSPSINLLENIIRMFVASMTQFVFVKVIDDVVSIIEEIKDERN